MTEEALAAVAEESETETKAEDEQQTKADEKEQAADTEAEADADTDESEDADEDEDDSDDDEADKPKRRGKSRNQRYADRISTQAAEKKAQAAEIAELQRKLDEVQKATATTPDPEPQLEDFETAAEFTAAVVKWSNKAALNEFRKETETEREKEAAARLGKARVQAFNDQLKDAKAFIPDYDDVLENATGPAPEEHVRALVSESERIPELIYHFAKNPHVLADMNEMSQLEAAREIGRLEATLVKPTPRKQSKAPPPVKPVRGAATPTKQLSEMSMAEYAKARTKQIYG